MTPLKASALIEQSEAYFAQCEARSKKCDELAANLTELTKGVRGNLFKLKVLAQQLRDLSRDEREADRIFKEIEAIIG